MSKKLHSIFLKSNVETTSNPADCQNSLLKIDFQYLIVITCYIRIDTTHKLKKKHQKTKISFEEKHYKQLDQQYHLLLRNSIAVFQL